MRARDQSQTAPQPRPTGSSQWPLRGGEETLCRGRKPTNLLVSRQRRGVVTFNFTGAVMAPPPLQIYQSSVAYGPTAIQTSGGYYHMGNVFMKEGNPDCAVSLHDQVWRREQLTCVCVCVCMCVCVLIKVHSCIMNIHPPMCAHGLSPPPLPPSPLDRPSASGSPTSAVC